MINNFYGGISSLSFSNLELNNELLKQKQQDKLLKYNKSATKSFSEEEVLDETIESGFEGEENYQQSDSDKDSNYNDNKTLQNQGGVIVPIDKQKTVVGHYLPKFLPLIKEQYSLESDMIFGWMPKVTHAAPIPLTFEDKFLDVLLENIEEKLQNYKHFELIYHGFRPDDTFKLHKLYSKANTYPFRFGNILFSKYENIQKYWRNDNTDDIRPFVGMNPKYIAKCKKNTKSISDEGNRSMNDESENGSSNNNSKMNTSNDANNSDIGIDSNTLIFDSQFESGNLDTVLKVGENEYNLFMRVDSNTRGHTNWYYFKVMGMKKNQKVKFNILNFSKPDSLYKQGKKPYVYSELNNKYMNKGWTQNADNVSYKLSPFGSHEDYFEALSKKKRYWKLSFEYTFLYENDKVYFALCIPYTYSDMLKLIKNLTENSENQNFVTQSTLCFSLSGIEVPMLHITDCENNEIPAEERDIIICTGRVHPGESNGSWMMQGFIEWICGQSEEAKYLRKKFSFKIIPMLNPDGVIIGNHRTGICGTDLNRQYISPDERLHPTIYSIKDLFTKIKKMTSNNIFAYIDFHGHSLRKNVFVYGAEFPLHHDNYYRVRILPKIISKNTDIFRYPACIFRISHTKIATSRAVFSQQYGVMNCYTLEASYASYIDKNKNIINFNVELFLEMGAIIGKSLHQYHLLLEEEKEAKRLKLERKKLEKLSYDKMKNISSLNHPNHPNNNNNNTNNEIITSDKSNSGTPINESQIPNSEKHIISKSQDMKRKKVSAVSISNGDIKATSGFSSATALNSEYNNGMSIQTQSKKFPRKFDLITPKDKKDAGKQVCETYTSNFNSLDLSMPKRSFSTISKDSDVKSKSKKKKSNLKKEKDILKINNEDDRGEEESNSEDIGINSLLKEIKMDIRTNKKHEISTNEISQGGSDSESSDDDLGEDEMKKLHKDILSKIEAFSAFVKNDIKPDFNKVKRNSKPTLTKKKSINCARHASVCSSIDIGEHTQKIDKNKSESPTRLSISKIKIASPLPDNSPRRGINNFRIKNIRTSLSPEKDRNANANNTTKNNENNQVAHNFISEYIYYDWDTLSTKFNILCNKVKTVKYESKSAGMKIRNKLTDQSKAPHLMETNDKTFMFSSNTKLDQEIQSTPNKLTTQMEKGVVNTPDKFRNLSSVQANKPKSATPKPGQRNEDMLPHKLNKLYYKLHKYFGRKGHNSAKQTPTNEFGYNMNSKLIKMSNSAKKSTYNENNDAFSGLAECRDHPVADSTQLLINANANPNQYLLNRTNSIGDNNNNNNNDYGSNLPNVKLEPQMPINHTSFNMNPYNNHLKDSNNFQISPVHVPIQARRKLPSAFESYNKMISKKRTEEEKAAKDRKKSVSAQNMNNSDLTKK